MMRFSKLQQEELRGKALAETIVLKMARDRHGTVPSCTGGWKVTMGAELERKKCEK